MADKMLNDLFELGNIPNCVLLPSLKFQYDIGTKMYTANPIFKEFMLPGTYILPYAIESVTQQHIRCQIWTYLR
jgi:hypothetical protein